MSKWGPRIWRVRIRDSRCAGALLVRLYVSRYLSSGKSDQQNGLGPRDEVCKGEWERDKDGGDETGAIPSEVVSRREGKGLFLLSLADDIGQ